MAKAPPATTLLNSVDEIVRASVAWSQPGDHLVVMSNGGFGGIHQKILEQLGNV